MFPAFDWLTVVDLLAVAVVLYALVLLIKNTRAFPLLLTAGALLGLYYIARWAHLTTLEWLLTSPAFYFLAFALIVIYQGEIRRELARLGRLPLVRQFAVRERSDPTDDIVLAAGFFSQKKIGALIVLERQISLRTYVESGIALDALLTYDLLVSIFLPRSPLHDGAAILSKNRVVAASCFLPLSLNPLLSTQLGTRHRAAIGVTEESDAVAVVVSEETGRISVMHGGTVELKLTPDQLRQRLRRLLQERSPRLSLAGRSPELS